MITKLRRYFKRTKSNWLWFLLGLVGGWLVSPSVLSSLVNFASRLPQEVLGVAIVVIAVFAVCISVYAAIVSNDLNRHKRYLKQYAPDLNIDQKEEFDEGFRDAVRDEEKP